MHGTTILAVRRLGVVALGGDGQVSLGQTIVKGDARKVRRLSGGKVIAGFAGGTADAFTLFERFEAKLEKHQGHLVRAAIELTKDWRTDRVLRRLEAMLADPELKPLDNNTARYFNRVAIDRGFGGIADEAEEGLRLVQSLGNHKTMLMGNHGLLCAGETVAEAFENMYFFERAAQTQLIAYSTGKELAILSDEIAEKTALGWEPYRGMSDAHFGYLKSQLKPLDG